MKAIVVGMGVQGKKRKKFLKKDFIYSVDKRKTSDFKSLQDVPINTYDSVFLCTPDNTKLKLIKYCLKFKKNVLVEKPLLTTASELNKIEKLFKRKKIFLYTAYNHRFEPSIKKAKEILQKGTIGKIYNAKIFYGNGTSKLVKKSEWRDKKGGIITDLGSHLFDICNFIFNKPLKKIKLVKSSRFENKSPDHAIINLFIKKIFVNLEMTYTMWKNSFYLDVIGSKGSIHINSLCKWSNSHLILRKRKLPSGKPQEQIFNYKKGDPTWFLENIYFKNKVKTKSSTNLKNDNLINNYIQKIIKK